MGWRAEQIVGEKKNTRKEASAGKSLIVTKRQREGLITADY